MTNYCFTNFQDSRIILRGAPFVKPMPTQSCAVLALQFRYREALNVTELCQNEILLTLVLFAMYSAPLSRLLLTLNSQALHPYIGAGCNLLARSDLSFESHKV